MFLSRVLLTFFVRRMKPTVGFVGAREAVPHFSAADPNKLTGYTLYYNGGVGQLAVLEIQRAVERGTSITVVAKNISSMQARDLVLAGAHVQLIDFDTRPIQLYNMIMDGVMPYVVLRNATWGQIVDLRKEERVARAKGGKGAATIYALGHFGEPCAKANSKKVPYKLAGKSKADEFREAGGIPVDISQERKDQCKLGSSALAFALGR